MRESHPSSREGTKRRNEEGVPYPPDILNASMRQVGVTFCLLIHTLFSRFLVDPYWANYT